MPPEPSERQVKSDQEARPDLMAALAESLDRPTWVIHLAKHVGPLSRRSETWVGVAEDRDAANAAALAWVRDSGYYVSYADGPFVPLRERDRLRAENEALKTTMSEAAGYLCMTQCPAYEDNGICSGGCYTEPACQTDQPTEGWIEAAINLLAPEGDESADETDEDGAS